MLLCCADINYSIVLILYLYSEDKKHKRLGPVTIRSTIFLSEKSSNTCEAISRFSKLKQIEPIGYTTDEINRMLNGGNTFIENILREGKDVKRM